MYLLFIYIYFNPQVLNLQQYTIQSASVSNSYGGFPLSEYRVFISQRDINVWGINIEIQASEETTLFKKENH